MAQLPPVSQESLYEKEIGTTEVSQALLAKNALGRLGLLRSVEGCPGSHSILLLSPFSP